MGEPSDVAGTSQAQRFLPQLDPDWIKLNGLPREAILAFAARFSALLRYYDLRDQVEGTFGDFFATDPEVQLAVIASFQAAPGVERLREEAELLLQVADPDSPVTPAEWARIGEALRSMTGTLDGWWRQLVNASLLEVFRLDLRSIITRELVPRLGALLTAVPELRSSVSGLDAELWRLNTLTSILGKDSRKAAHDLLVPLAEALGSASRAISSDARRWLDTEEVQKAPRPAHMALFLTFLRLREHPLQLMNELPARELRYYYEQILQQAPRPPIPDSAIVSFQPARKAVPLLLPAGTLLAAGKDSLGQPRMYQLVRDTLVDQVALARVMTLAVSGGTSASPPQPGVVLTCFEPASPTVNSITPASPFPAFGAVPLPGSAAASLPTSQVGVAICSPVLELGGGQRSIELSIELKGALHSPPLAVDFQVKLSGPKGWFDAPCTTTRSGDTLTLSISLDPSLPAVAPYSAAVLGPQFRDGPPVMLALFDQAVSAVAGSELMRACVSQVKIQVSVQGTRAFTVGSSAGPLALGKPFAPFGQAPPLSALFMVGFPEAFQKRLTSLDVHLSWLNLPAGPQYPYGFASYYSGYELALAPPSLDGSLPPPAYLDSSFQVQLQYRLDSQWLSLNTAPGSVTDFPLFMSVASPPSPLGATTDLSATAPRGQYLNTPATGLPPSLSLSKLPAAGVLGIRLTAPPYGFGQSLYGPASAALALRTMATLLALAKQEGSSPPGQGSPILVNLSPPAEDPNTMADPADWVRTLPSALSLPYTPMVEDVSLDYSAEEELGPGAAGQISLWQVGPLGTVPIALTPPVGTVPPGAAATLLPELSPGGSLFLGFSGMAPGAQVSCLFVIQDEGAAAASRPPGDIAWSYYDGQRWCPLGRVSAVGSTRLNAQAGVVDQTAALGRSGLMTFVLPPDAADWPAQHSPGIRWFRGDVGDPEAFPELVSIQPQATWCSRVLNPAGVQAYGMALPAGSITQLATANANIASVTQSLPSEPGAAAEGIRMFHARVSERTRHKARAVMAWDYERLALEQFPWIFAARCLPGWTFSGLGFKQGRAGDVLLLVSPCVPDASVLTASNYVPSVDLGRLSEIRAFLAGLAPAAATVSVANPVYVPVKVTSSFTVVETENPAVAEQQLNAELCALLSPWIFAPAKARSLTGVSSTLQILRFVETRPYVSKVTELDCQLGNALASDGALGSLGMRPCEVPVSVWQHALTAVSELG